MIKKSYTGFPEGNSIALVGDPGTGKTTFLLSFFRYAIIESSRVQLQLPGSANSFTDLFLFNPHRVEKTKYTKGYLRIFVSLESSFSRMLKNNQTLLGEEAQWKNDIFVFIDATSFLSGRLQDRLRYPNLVKNISQDADFWRESEFNLGGFTPAESKEFGLYWQPDGELEPIPIEQLRQECPKNGLDNYPFCIKGGCKGKWGNVVEPNTCRHSRNGKPTKGDFRLYNLMTPSLGDPIKRVTLLKDLLAEIFMRFQDHERRFLAIDSLSALLARFEGQETSDNNSDTNDIDQPRRLPMLNLIRWLEEHDVTTMMSCEADRTSQNTIGGQALFLGTDERYLSSGVIQLDYHRYKSGDMIRYFRILKMRGCQHDMRPHAYDLDGNGISWIEPLFGEPQGEVV